MENYLGLVLGANVTYLRKLKGFNQVKDLCDKVDLSYNKLTRIARGECRSASWTTIEKIAKALEVEPYELFIDHFKN